VPRPTDTNGKNMAFMKSRATVDQSASRTQVGTTLLINGSGFPVYRELYEILTVTGPVNSGWT